MFGRCEWEKKNAFGGEVFRVRVMGDFYILSTFSCMFGVFFSCDE